MRTLDDTDLEILRLLIEDARRPYSEIAETVDVSPPTVSDRIDRLRELGVIERFTVEVDRSTVSGGVEVLADVSLRADADDRVVERCGSLEPVEHVFRTVDGRLFLTATVQPSQIGGLLGNALDPDLVEEYRVHLLEDRRWNPDVGDVDLALVCDECSNSVTSEGSSLRLDDTLYHFCCPTCRSRFEERYVSLAESA